MLCDLQTLEEFIGSAAVSAYSEQMQHQIHVFVTWSSIDPFDQ